MNGVGTRTTVHSFSGSDGETPLSGVIQGANGDYYGITNVGGPDSVGTIFRITPNGVFRPFTTFFSITAATRKASFPWVCS